MNDRPRLLLIEDEDAIREPLVDALTDEGYAVLEAADGEQGLALALREDPDLILLDLMLPKRDGFSVLRAIRADRLTAPVIVLSARGEEWDRVQGFEVGADDYVVKPFSLPELLGRCRALLERARGGAPGVSAGEARTRIGGVEIDWQAYTLVRDGASIGLSRTELELLRCFVERPGAVLTRDELLDRVWGRGTSSGPRTVDQHVLKLRKKLELDPERPRHLLTLRNVGYKFEL